VRAVCFDFAGTLFSDRALRDVHLRQLRFVAEAAGVEASDDDLRAAYKRGMGVAYRAVASGPFYSHRELFGRALSETAVALAGAISPEQEREAVDRQYRATIETATLRPDAAAAIDELRADGIHVQVVSNIDDEQLLPMIDRFGLTDRLDAITSSEAAGSCKPDPEIYRVALAKAQCEPGEVLFVGDSLQHDIQGPHAAGMWTALLTVDAKPATSDVTPDFVIAALAEVPGVVRGMVTT
jgi:HAD superfamily hydrolase (TIGR01509 family)